MTMHITGCYCYWCCFKRQRDGEPGVAATPPTAEEGSTGSQDGAHDLCTGKNPTTRAAGKWDTEAVCSEWDEVQAAGGAYCPCPASIFANRDVPALLVRIVYLERCIRRATQDPEIGAHAAACLAEAGA